MNKEAESIINIGIFGLNNSGKCTLSKQLTILYGSIAIPNFFSFNNKKYHLFPIPCTQPEYNENFEISILNSDIVFILIDTSVEIKIQKDNEAFYLNLLSQCFMNKIKHIIFIFNKIDINTYSEEDKDIFKKNMKEIIDKLQLFYNFKNKYLEENNLFFIDLNCKDDSQFEHLLKCVDKKKQNKQADLLLIPIFDWYIDSEEKNLVVSGKIIKGSLNKNSILHLLPLNKNDNKNNILKPLKFCNSKGEYLDNLNKKEFITIKFDNDDYQKQNIILNKNNVFVSYNVSNEYPVSQMQIIETELFFINQPCSIISKGFECIFSSYTSNCKCEFENIIGEVQNNMLVKKKFINCKKYNVIKAILKIEEPIVRCKYENSKKLGSFSLKVNGNIFAVGKINKYKKYLIE